MTQDDWQCRKQDLGRYRRKMAKTLRRLSLWADGEGLERLRQLRLDERQWPDSGYPATLITPKTRQKGENR